MPGQLSMTKFYSALIFRLSGLLRKAMTGNNVILFFVFENDRDPEEQISMENWQYADSLVSDIDLKDIVYIVYTNYTLT